MITTSIISRSFLPTPAAVLAAVVAAAGVGVAANAVIALVAHHLGVPGGFKPLQASSFVALTVLGVLAGAIGWAVIRGRAGDPRRLLTRLVPAVIAVSLIPDLAVGVGRLETHTTWGGVTALMLMHLAVATCAVTAYHFLLPLPPRRPASRRTRPELRLSADVIR